ncbi:MAG: phosphatidate cytidylyltransferase [Rickettsiales bacterium]|nr:phosphatidate cytidylyltransferase [Rickettsiales bacterium]
MSDTTKRLLTAAVMCLVAFAACVGQYFSFKYFDVRVLLWCIVIMMGMEWIDKVFGVDTRSFWAKRKNPREKTHLPAWRRWMGFAGIAYFIFIMGPAADSVGSRPWIVLLLLLIISFADIGAWFFGRLIGGDKMWVRLSAGKTWSGQIAGILCGTFAAVMYGLLGIDSFLPQLLWIGISISLMSQYGDLTASWVKRKIGIKDFGNTLPGHGGVIDRFDGWIYVLPIVWLIML